MEVEISIDKITDCPIDTTTGREVETEYRMCETPIRPKDYKRKNPASIRKNQQGATLLVFLL